MFRNILKITHVVSSGECLAMLFGLASATTKAADEPTPVPPPVVFPSNPLKEGTKFTIDSLGTALEELGYDAQRMMNNGTEYYLIRYREGHLGGNIAVSLSGNQRFLWLSSGVIDLEPGESLPLDVSEQMLAYNEKEFFAVRRDSAGKLHVQLKSCQPNHRVTREMLREQIRDLGAAVAQCEKLWNKSLWTSQSALAAQAAPPVAGK